MTNDDSLAERIQRAYPDGRVVKSLNTVTAAVMVDPRAVGDGEHTMFVAGNDGDAKEQVTRVLVGGFGWSTSSISVVWMPPAGWRCTWPSGSA